MMTKEQKQQYNEERLEKVYKLLEECFWSEFDYDTHSILDRAYKRCQSLVIHS